MVAAFPWHVGVAALAGRATGIANKAAARAAMSAPTMSGRWTTVVRYIADSQKTG
jgi:hypothetical protein